MMPMTHSLRLIVLTGFCLASCGCSTMPQRITDWPGSMPTMQSRAGLDLFYRNSAFHPQLYQALLVTPPTLPADAPNTFAQRIANAFQQRLREHLTVMRLVPRVTTDAKDILPDERLLLLETRLIQLTPGSQLLRWWCGELGCGHAIIEVQGRLIDAKTGEVFAAFADKRRGAAVIDPTGGSGEDLLREDMLGIVRDLAAALR